MLRTKAYVVAIGVPLLLALIYQLALALGGSALFGSETQDSPLPLTILIEVLRAAIVIWAGWRVVKLSAGGLLAASIAGALVLVVDHVFLKGGWFLLDYILGAGDDYLTAFWGVIVSFLMFLPLMLLLGLSGGLLARRKERYAL